jgi:acyl transferase domain-containing protein
VFTGQGAQWFGMGRELITMSTCFKNSIMESDRSLRSIGCDWSLLEELSKPSSESRVGQSEISQPSTTAIQIALVDLLASFGIIPSCVVGHSSGEIAGAYAAGALSLDAAIQALV